MKDEGQDYIQFKINRNISRITKDFLNLLEDCFAETQENFTKLQNSLPNESFIIGQGNTLTEDKFKRLRKRILDIGGDVSRELISELDKLEIKFK